MKIPKLHFFALTIFLQAPVAADDQWLQEHIAAIDSAATLPEEEAIELLGRRLIIGARPVMSEQQRQVFEKAQAALLSMPHHAQHYGDKMTRLLDAVNKQPDPQSKKIIYYNQDANAIDENGIPIIDPIPYDYTKAQEDLKLLRFLPSAESVRVLGGFLRNPQGRNGTDPFGKPWADLNSEQGVSVDAALALSEIGIEKPPIQLPMVREGMWEQVDAWKDWWHEVETGKRTYRFKGSPVEYGPDGPVDPTKLKSRDRDPARLGGADRSHRESGPGDATGNEQSARSKGMVAAGLGALLLLALAAWRAFSGKKTTAGS